MTQGKRFGLSAAQKRGVWRRWKAGQSLHKIRRAFGKEHSSIRCLVSRHGGFVPAVRRRSLLALTLSEREEISRGLACGSSIREIAKRLDLFQCFHFLGMSDLEATGGAGSIKSLEPPSPGPQRSHAHTPAKLGNLRN